MVWRGADLGRGNPDEMENPAAGPARRHQDLRSGQDHTGLCTCLCVRFDVEVGVCIRVYCYLEMKMPAICGPSVRLLVRLFCAVCGGG